MFILEKLLAARTAPEFHALLHHNISIDKYSSFLAPTTSTFSAISEGHQEQIDVPDSHFGSVTLKKCIAGGRLPAS